MKFWTTWFLEERPTLGMALFRFMLAFTVGAHILPSLIRLDENYLSGAFITLNPSFFPVPVLRFVAGLPDIAVVAMAVFFVFSLAAFALGFHTRVSCILMTLGAYFFYARNAFQIGTLSFDILLVMLAVVCTTASPGDALSLDALRKGWTDGWRRKRVFAPQRLLQLQLTWIYWYTAAGKIAAQGNWLKENPFWYLVRYPEEGVVRAFPGREWLAAQPEVCYWLGAALIVFEFVMPLLWWIPKTRLVGIGLGIAFHLMLWIMLHVPTIFLFLFPAMMFLFIPPEDLTGWVMSRRRLHYARGKRPVLVYDGQCGFCAGAVKRLDVLDLTDRVALQDVHALERPEALHRDLTRERGLKEMVLVEAGRELSGGYYAFRRLARMIPFLWPVLPLLYLPGAGPIGSAVYRWVARNRYRFSGASCGSGACERHGSDERRATSDERVG